MLGSVSARSSVKVLSPLLFFQLSGAMLRLGLPFSSSGRFFAAVRRFAAHTRRIRVLALLQQRHGLAVVAVGEVFQRFAVDVVDFQRQLAGAEVVALHLERVHGVVDLAADVAAALLAELAHQS